MTTPVMRTPASPANRPIASSPVNAVRAHIVALSNHTLRVPKHRVHRGGNIDTDPN